MENHIHFAIRPGKDSSLSIAGRADEWEYGGICHFIKGETSILDIPP
jgi:hypothetical protein